MSPTVPVPDGEPIIWRRPDWDRYYGFKECCRGRTVCLCGRRIPERARGMIEQTGALVRVLEDCGVIASIGPAGASPKRDAAQHFGAQLLVDQVGEKRDLLDAVARQDALAIRLST